MMLVTSSFRKGRQVGTGGIGYIWILFLCFLWSSEIQQECEGDSLMLAGVRSGVERSPGRGGEWSLSDTRRLPRWLGFYLLRTEK